MSDSADSDGDFLPNKKSRRMTSKIHSDSESEEDLPLVPTNSIENNNCCKHTSVNWTSVNLKKRELSKSLSIFWIVHIEGFY